LLQLKAKETELKYQKAESQVSLMKTEVTGLEGALKQLEEQLKAANS